MNSVLAHAAQVFEAKDLIPAAVGQDGTVPCHETMQSTRLFDKIDARPQIQMVGIGQNDLGADLAQFMRGRCLNRSLGCYWHECRRLYRAVSRTHQAKTSLGVGILLYHAKAEHEEGNYTRAPEASGFVGSF